MTSQELLVGGTRVDMRGRAIREAFAAEPAVQEGGVEGAWDPATRAREMDRDGVAGEVVFPDGLYQNGVPFHGMPRFQVTRMVSNMLSGAIEVASNDSEISTPALRMRSSASR